MNFGKMSSTGCKDESICPPKYKKIEQTPRVTKTTYECGPSEPHQTKCHDHSDYGSYGTIGMFVLFFIFILIIMFAIFWISKPEFCQSLDGNGHPCGEVDICTAFVSAFIGAIILTAFVCIIVAMVKKY